MIPEYRILVVDDDPGDTRMIQLAVAESSFPCQIVTAANGREALSLLHQAGSGPDRPDLILLDLNMPQMNGQETLRAIKADPRLAAIPVVVMTTSSAGRDIEDSYALGASGFVTKPMDMESFFEAIHRVEEYWFRTVRRPHDRLA